MMMLMMTLPSSQSLYATQNLCWVHTKLLAVAGDTFSGLTTHPTPLPSAPSGKSDHAFGIQFG